MRVYMALAIRDKNCLLCFFLTLTFHASFETEKKKFSKSSEFMAQNNHYCQIKSTLSNHCVSLFLFAHTRTETSSGRTDGRTDNGQTDGQTLSILTDVLERNISHFNDASLLAK